MAPQALPASTQTPDLHPNSTSPAPQFHQPSPECPAGHCCHRGSTANVPVSSQDSTQPGAASPKAPSRISGQDCGRRRLRGDNSLHTQGTCFGRKLDRASSGWEFLPCFRMWSNTANFSREGESSPCICKDTLSDGPRLLCRGVDYSFM